MTALPTETRISVRCADNHKDVEVFALVRHDVAHFPELNGCSEVPFAADDVEYARGRVGVWLFDNGAQMRELYGGEVISTPSDSREGTTYDEHLIRPRCPICGSTGNMPAGIRIETLRRVFETLADNGVSSLSLDGPGTTLDPR